MSKKNPFNPSKLMMHVLLIAGALVMMYPLLWMISSSLKPSEIIFRDLSLIPAEFTLQNYIEGWDALSFPFWVYFINSTFVTVMGVIGNVLTCSLTAYAFARLNFKFKRIWFALMLMTIMLPYHVTLVPQYILFNELGWVNTYAPLIVPHFLATDAFFIFLNVQFIRSISSELDEAAKVDGANAFQIYWKIILPLSKPALATTAIFTFIWKWDDFFSHLLYISDQSMYTIPLALRSFVDASASSNYGALFAMSILSLVPVFIFFIVAQRAIVEGISTTGFK